MAPNDEQQGEINKQTVAIQQRGFAELFLNPALMFRTKDLCHLRSQRHKAWRRVKLCFGSGKWVPFLGPNIYQTYREGEFLRETFSGNTLPWPSISRIFRQRFKYITVSDMYISSSQNSLGARVCVCVCVCVCQLAKPFMQLLLSVESTRPN